MYIQIAFDTWLSFCGGAILLIIVAITCTCHPDQGRYCLVNFDQTHVWSVVFVKLINSTTFKVKWITLVDKPVHSDLWAFAYLYQTCSSASVQNEIKTTRAAMIGDWVSAQDWTCISFNETSLKLFGSRG